jgi:hypothetical protein
MELKNTINTEFEEIKIPNENIKTKDEKGIFQKIQNIFVNIKKRDKTIKEKTIIKKIKKTEKINKKYQKKIMDLKNKYQKKANKYEIEIKQNKDDLIYITKNLNKKDAIKILKEPLLLLLKEDKKIEVYQNIKTGWFPVPTKKKSRKLIYNDVTKAFDFEIGNNTYKTIIQYENNAFPYPLEPIIDAEKNTAIMELTWAQAKAEDDLENSDKIKWTNWIIYGIIAIIVIIILIKGLPMLINTLGIGGDQAVQNVSTIAKGGAIDINALPIK